MLEIQAYLGDRKCVNPKKATLEMVLTFSVDRLFHQQQQAALSATTGAAAAAHISINQTRLKGHSQIAAIDLILCQLCSPVSGPVFTFQQPSRPLPIWSLLPFF